MVLADAPPGCERLLGPPIGIGSPDLVGHRACDEPDEGVQSVEHGLALRLTDQRTYPLPRLRARRGLPVQPKRRRTEVTPDDPVRLADLDLAGAGDDQLGGVFLEAQQLDRVVVVILESEFLASALHVRRPAHHCLLVCRFRRLADLLQPVAHRVIEGVSRGVADLQAHSLLVEPVVDLDLAADFLDQAQDLLDEFVQAVVEDRVDVIRQVAALEMVGHAE